MSATARARLLATAAAAHDAWVFEHADQVAADPADSDPHDDDGSDYAEHHADRSAPAKVDDVLSRQLAAMLGRPVAEAPAAATSKRKGKSGGTVGSTEEAGRVVDDAGDVMLAEGWAPAVPNVLMDLREAGGDRKLRAYWVRGEGAGKIDWGSDGDFTRCVSHLGKYVDDPQGLCAEYHKAATGKWPAEK
jgi:hypothetical protein